MFRLLTRTPIGLARLRLPSTQGKSWLRSEFGCGRVEDQARVEVVAMLEGERLFTGAHDDRVHYAGRQTLSGFIDAASMTSSTSLLRAEGASVAISPTCRHH